MTLPAAAIPLRPWQLGLMFFIALSPSLGTAVAALGRLVLMLWALFALLMPHKASGKSEAWSLHKPITVSILLACFYMALSTLWSYVDSERIWFSWTNHARLLTIPLVFYLLRDPAQGRQVLRVFIGTQIFVGFSSWLLIAGYTPPWISGTDSQTTFASYGSYLEESIVQATSAGLLWFQRDWIFGPKGRWLAIAMALSCATISAVYLPGRSGHMVLLALSALIVFQALPKRMRWLALFVPFLVGVLLWFGAPNFKHRLLSVYTEVVSFNQQANAASSSGLRLQYWKSSLQSYAESPILGHGAGSWNSEFLNQLAKHPNPTVEPNHSSHNPHQLFLLWAVEGGTIGLLCLIFTLIYVVKNSSYLPRQDTWSLYA
ncbi:MAG: O-antigen ligase family protein, partial [Rhodoferax sp.]|nr:O-antigen ligase family protein [Rhodoferax sp.]